jgi:hypothetical protein
MRKKTDLGPEEYRKKWGVPDWRDKQAYPTRLTDTLWRWEFLRRRPGYRRDWERARNTTVKWYAEHTAEEFFQRRLPGPLGDGRVYPNNWKLNPDDPRLGVHMADCLPKYRLRNPRNPNDARPRSLDFESCFLLAPGTIVPRPMALQLSPGVSIKEHVALLTAALKGLRHSAKARRNRRTEWASYLRALDAKACGATDKEVWEVIVGNQAYNPYSRGGDLVRAAENLRDNDLP